jgi:cell division protein FtsL
MNARRLFPLLLVLVLCSALALVYVRHENRRLFSELQGLQLQRDELDIEWGRLQLEEAALADAATIDQVARQELRMRHPQPDEVVYVEPWLPAKR